MDSQGVRDLIGRLIESTRSGKFRWQETADENLFRLVLDAGIIHVRRIRMQHVSATRGPDNYDLVFLNQNSTPVEDWQPDQGRDIEQLKALYEAARDSALKPSEFLRNLEKEVIRRSG